MSSLITIICIIICLLIISGICTVNESWKESVEIFLGFSFFSAPYFTIIGLVLIVGIIFSIATTIYISYPFSKWLKEKILSISEGADAFSRGKLDFRISTIDGIAEINEVAMQFNNMADRFENQVSTLQNLVAENTSLIKKEKDNVILSERRKLAAELHDAISQQLFSISMNISSIALLWNSDSDKAKKLLAQVECMVENSQLELRALIMHLRPVDLEGTNLCSGIEQLLNELQKKHTHIKWGWEINTNINMNKGLENQLFRVVQEAVSNMLRHSKASQFKLKLFLEQKRILLFIEDNGEGIDISKNKKSSYGLQMMRERVEGIGGRFDIISYLGTGTRIEVRVPITKLGQGEYNE